ncbi:hypothetical protein BGZ83_005665 [Gryganskiella cystojenkinii]|nr:hypothetical protein BGZ83_005665 [Gryganskiella cystojenkinii]
MDATTTAVRGGVPSTNPAVATPTYPLLRMTLVAMLNLSVAYATLSLIPSFALNYSNLSSSTSTGDSNATKENADNHSHHGTGSIEGLQTLPSLSWTILSLFAFQTVIGLVQAYLHQTSSASQPTKVRKPGQGKKKKGSSSAAGSATATGSSLSSTSLFGVLNTSISIGAVGTLICHVFAVLFGAGLVYQAKETSQLACYLSLLTFYPASFVLGTDVSSWLRIFIHNSPETYTEAAFYCQGMMAIFGAWLGSIVIPLDWDRPWQAWPVPCILGAFLFYMIGTMVGLVVSIVMRQRAARREFLGDDYQEQVKKTKKSQ